jgi:ketosteroid isomerase-like protein
MQQVSAAERVVERLISAVNKRRLDELEHLYSADARARRPGWPVEAGTPELMSSYRIDLIAVPDLQLRPESSTSDGTTVCTELTITGTNTGPTGLGDFGHALLGADVDRLEPSCRSFELQALFVHEARGGRIRAERQYCDLLEYLVQIGAVAAAQPTAAA